MALYTCKIGSADGKILEREFEALNLENLRETLVEQGFHVFEIRRKSFQFIWKRGSARRRVDNKELLTFNQELLVLIKSGLPIIQVLDTILERGDKSNLSEIIKNVREEIKGGSALSDAFERYPGAFSPLYVASIRAGERTGDLPQTIRRFILFLKKTEMFKRKVISALFYPAILLTAAFLAVTMLLVYVVPTFSQVYSDSGAQLPLPTQMLIAFTSALKKMFPFLVAGTFLSIYALRNWVRTPQGRFAADRFKLRIPFVGDVVQKYAVVGFTRTFATVLESGIPIVESMKMSVGTLNNRVLERKLLDAVLKVEEGTSLAVAIEGVRLFPPLALRMLGVGETTGSLEEMLGSISDYFEEEIDQRLNILSTAIEPAIMVIMGLVIGVIIITMYLPIFKIAGTVG